jgi:MFS family permease
VDLIGVLLLVDALPRLLPKGTFRARRGLQTVVLLRGLSSGSYYTLESFGPPMLISERHVSAVVTGATFTVAAICWTGASRLQSRRWAELSRVRLVRRGAAVLGLATVLGVCGAWPAMPVLTASAALVVAAFGMGLLVPGLTLLTFDAAEPGRRGEAQASTQLSMNVGQITAMSAAGALFAAAFGVHPAHGSWAPYAVALALPTALSTLAFLLAGRAQPAGHGS